jgi:uncharacterized protein (DUF1697 family)
MSATNITYIALLRGINVGRAKRIAMADLRALAEHLGYRDVRTLLNSGNVVFSGAKAKSATVAGSIEAGVKERLGVDSRVTVLTAAELVTVIDENPLLRVGQNPSLLLVAVPARTDGCASLKPLLKSAWKPEALAVCSRAAYLWCPGGSIASRVAEAVNRALGDAVTTRNWATMLKLRDLAAKPLP